MKKMFKIKLHYFFVYFHLKLHQPFVWVINDFCTILRRTLVERIFFKAIFTTFQSKSDENLTFLSIFLWNIKIKV